MLEPSGMDVGSSVVESTLVLRGASGMSLKRKVFAALAYSNHVSIKKSPVGLL